VADIAYWAVLIGVFVTAFYSFRMYFLVFHGKERFHQGHAHGNEPDAHHDEHHGHGGTPHETPWVVTGPLLALALPSLAIGYMTIEPMLFGEFFGNAIYVADRHPVMHELNQHFHGAAAMGLHGDDAAVLAGGGRGGPVGVLLSQASGYSGGDRAALRFLHQMLLNKYWFDELYSWVFAKGARAARRHPVAARRPERDRRLLRQRHGASGRTFLRLVKAFQSGYIYHYAFAMLIGVFALVTWFARLN
jgi:NADH-quinone oxidoreductase subunit L